jgi:hypothetical protein
MKSLARHPQLSGLMSRINSSLDALEALIVRRLCRYPSRMQPLIRQRRLAFSCQLINRRWWI